MAEAITKARIARDLRENLGLAPGDRIAVHSSMKSLGRVEGGPIAVIEALIEAVGGPDAGTVLMPCFTGALDVCDVRHSRSRVGLVSETFRTYPGVRLSPNHTHRVAVYGRDAQAIADCHVGTSPLGTGSPFHELTRRGGSVIHIGCDFRSSSLIHVAEHLFPLPYNDAQITFPGYDKEVTLIREDGTRIVCPPLDNPGDSQGFLVLQERMDRYGLIRHGPVGEAQCMRVRGLDVLAMAMDMMREDPAALLCRAPGCQVCRAKRRLAEAWQSGRADRSGPPAP